MSCHFPCDLTLMAFFSFSCDPVPFDFWSQVDHICDDSTTHSSLQTKRSIKESLLTSSTVQGCQIPSSSTASALKPTVYGSTNAFLVNCAFSSCDRNRFAINKVVSNVFRQLKCLIAHVPTKIEFLMNYTLCQSRSQSPRAFWSAPTHGALE